MFYVHLLYILKLKRTNESSRYQSWQDIIINYIAMKRSRCRATPLSPALPPSDSGLIISQTEILQGPTPVPGYLSSFDLAPSTLSPVRLLAGPQIPMVFP